MNLLLDTYVLLWWVEGSARLPAQARDAVAAASVVFVSAASLWEAIIKERLGKLRLPGPLTEAVASSGFTELPIRFRHAAELAALPHHHSDPFDRMLVAQARVERLRLATRDRALSQYEVELLQL